MKTLLLVLMFVLAACGDDTTSMNVNVDENGNMDDCSAQCIGNDSDGLTDEECLQQCR